MSVNDFIFIKIQLHKKNKVTFFHFNNCDYNPFFLTEREENAYVVNISEDQADEIRDLCGDQLQLVGFDEKYDPTSEGKILEDLVDKFYIG